MNILDLSNHDEPTFDAACMRAAGVTRVIMGCQMGGWPARRMVPALRAAGIEVRDLYAFLGFRNWWLQPTRTAIQVAGELGGIERIWLDAEADDPNDGTSGDDVTPEQRVARLAQAVDLVERAGFPVGIYSARWFWLPRIGNSTRFRAYPLWLGGPYQAEPIREVDFGGWTTVAIHQYTSTLEVCGRGRDANYWFAEEEDSMTDDDLLAIFAGGEERDDQGELKPREERLTLARFRRDEAAAGRAPSVRDLASGSHTHTAPQPPVGPVPDHTHRAGEVVR